MTELQREDWERVDRLFSAALDIPDADRERFLRGSGEPAEVVARVRRLLAAEREAEERIGESAEALAEGVMDGASPRVEDLQPGTDLGPYRIVREIGRGGMGTVYLAERSDDSYQRQVALKVVKRGMDTDEVVTRFRREGRILARLEHPGIGRMYDADVAPDGRPFLVLEYIDGRPIDLQCDSERLTVEERLRLFLRVCDAVAFAHTKLVLHRDLKPSNILVTRDGPRLLDFGVGKVLDDEGLETRELTAAVGRRLTPEYASPEQLSGGAISTASDVYSLGVVLHELLTGARPGATGTRLPSETVTDSNDADDAREAAASRRSTPQRLARRLHGDLDVILMKALHEDVNRRYSSVESFAADLRRHLDGRPVTARPDSVRYRTRKFISRNRLPVLSGSGLGLSVLFFAIATGLQQAETARERDRADQERVRAEEVATVLEEMFAGAGFESRDRIDTLSVRQFLERSAEQVVGELEGQPVVQGTLLRILGDAQHGFGRLPEADTLLTRAVAVLESAEATDVDQLQRARTELGNLRMRQGRWDDARSQYEAVLVEETDRTPGQIAQMNHNIGLALLNKGQADSAAARLDISLTIHRADPTLDPVGFASSLTMRAGVAQRMGDMSSATALAGEAVDIMTAELGPDHPQVLTMEHNHAFMVYRSRGAEEAVSLFADLHDRYRAIVGESAELSTLLQNYGSVLRDTGRPDESLPLIEEAVRLDRRTPGPPLSYSLDALGSTLAALDRNADALAAFSEALEATEAVFGPEHPNTAMGRLAVASSTCRQDRTAADAALERFDEAEAALAAVFPPGHRRIVDAGVRRGACYLTLNMPAEAESVLEPAVAALERDAAGATELEAARDLLARARSGG